MGGVALKMFSHSKTDRQTEGPTPLPMPASFPKGLAALPRAGQCLAPTFPVAPCRPCPLAASPSPCRSQPLRSPPPPGQLPRIGVARSGLGPKHPPSRETPEPGWPSLRNSDPPPAHHLSLPSELLPGAAPSEGRGKARMARSPARAKSSFISTTRPQAQSVSKAHGAFGRREPHHPAPPSPSLEPSYPSPTSIGLAYGQSPGLLEGGVHSAPPLLASVTQPPQDLTSEVT